MNKFDHYYISIVLVSVSFEVDCEKMIPNA